MMEVRRLPDLESLKKLLQRDPAMLKNSQNATSLIGSSESMEYINQLIAEKTKK